jgi:nucleoid DNA-binding protein
MGVAVTKDDLLAMLAMLKDLFEAPAEAVVKVVREELRRRLREGEPAALWEAAEFYIEMQLASSNNALTAVIEYLERQITSPPPDPPSC